MHWKEKKKLKSEASQKRIAKRQAMYEAIVPTPEELTYVDMGIKYYLSALNIKDKDLGEFRYIAYMSLLTSLHMYDPEKDVRNDKKYYCMCNIKRSLVQNWKREHTYPTSHNQMFLSFNSLIDNDSEYLNLIPDKKVDKDKYRQECDEYFQGFADCLSKTEKIVYEHIVNHKEDIIGITSFPLVQMSEDLDMSVKVIDNTLTRIRIKASRYAVQCPPPTL